MNAGIARISRTRIVSRLWGAAGAMSTSIGYPGAPVKLGNGFAAMKKYALTCVWYRSYAARKVCSDVRDAPRHERDEPGRDHDEEHADPPDREPEEVREGEEEPEEDGEPAALQVVGDDEMDRMALGARKLADVRGARTRGLLLPGQVAGEVGCALLQEGGDPFREVGRSDGLLLELRLERELGLHTGRVGVLEELLRPADRERRTRGPFGRELRDARLERVRLDHLRHEPPRERLVGGKPSCSSTSTRTHGRIRAGGG